MESLSNGTKPLISKIDMFSMPAAIPHSIWPALILAATIATASIPLLQNLLRVVIGTVYGISPKI